MTITGFSWAMPSAFLSGASSFPVLVSVRNNASIVDNDPTNARHSGMGGVGGSAANTITAATDWVPIINASITQTGGYAQLPAFSAVTIAAGTKAAFWFRFTDLNKPMRANLPKLGTIPYTNGNYGITSTDCGWRVKGWCLSGSGSLKF